MCFSKVSSVIIDGRRGSIIEDGGDDDCCNEREIVCPLLWRSTAALPSAVNEEALLGTCIQSSSLVGFGAEPPRDFLAFSGSPILLADLLLPRPVVAGTFFKTGGVNRYPASISASLVWKGSNCN